MNQSLVHRGPDDSGYWVDEGSAVYIGHRRLSIIDINDGSQPMTTEEGDLIVVFNGEIYNHLELRDTLQKRGHAFRTNHSDTEVLLHGFREWGVRLPEYLNGMWAFAIYDRFARSLFLCRDRFGMKPLFYGYLNGVFVFGSELSALDKHSAVSHTVSIPSLKKYFAYGYIPAPNSLYEGIYKLPGGHYMNYNLNGKELSVSKYWEFVIEPTDPVKENPEALWAEEIRDLLRKAVQRRLMSDVPLGVFLSGGIDSSAVTAYAARALGGDNLNTFSIGFSEDSFDESDFAQLTSDAFGTKHNSRILSMEQSETSLSEIFNKMDEPIGDSSILPTYLLCRETRKHVTVAIGGDGGDELFGGYDPFRALKLAEIYKKLIPRPIHKAIRLVVSRLPVSYENISMDFKLKRTLNGLTYSKRLWNPVWMGPLEPSDLYQLFQEPTDIEDVYSEAIDYWDTCGQDNIIDKTLTFFTKLYLQDDILVKIDRASMMHSLEVRAPFLDIDLVNFARKIPANYKIRFGTTKYILKKALQPVLPSQIINRPKKGFGVPIGKWFKENRLNISKANYPGRLNQKFIHEKRQEHLNGICDHRLFLWNLLVLNQMNS